MYHCNTKKYGKNQEIFVWKNGLLPDRPNVYSVLVQFFKIPGCNNGLSPAKKMGYVNIYLAAIVGYGHVFFKWSKMTFGCHLAFGARNILAHSSK